MPITRRMSRMTSITSAMMLLAIGLAVAQDGRAPSTNEAPEQRHRRLIEEGERASRAIPPSPPPESLPNNGIEKIPIDTSRRSGFFKEDGTPEEQRPPQRGPNISAQACPYAQGWKIISLMKVFPEVTWHVCARDMGRKGLWIGPVHLRRTPGGPWVKVLYQAGLADIFVPYHQTNFRPYDLRWTTQLDQVTAQDRGINGILHVLTDEPMPTVVAEIRERGVGWLCKQDTMTTRRAQEFVVWGVSDGGNYDNIVEYSFRDDGGITFRMGNTGYNNFISPSHPSSPPATEAHTHNALWRVDIDLNGGLNNSAYWLSHVEPSPPSSALKAQDRKDQIKTEGARRWDLPRFTTLLIEDAATNAFGNRLGYELSPLQTATSRHSGPKEAWTQNDVYVTKYRASELAWAETSATWLSPDDYLLTHLNGESLMGTDLVVWIKSSVHHHPTDEDRSGFDLALGTITGVTLTHWSGFSLEPHNLFDANPMGGPMRCGS